MDLLKELGALAHRAHRLELELCELVDDLTSLVDKVGGTVALTVSGRKRGRIGKALREVERVLRRQAERGAASLIIERRAGERVVIKVGGFPEMRLTPALGDLLECLGSDDGDHDGCLVAYKPVAVLGDLLREKRDGTFTRHAVNNLVYRLRGAFDRNGVNRYLIQMHRKHGYRFAVQRNGMLVTGSEAA